jgi:hypothetical protein
MNSVQLKVMFELLVISVLGPEAGCSEVKCGFPQALCTGIMPSIKLLPFPCTFQSIHNNVPIKGCKTHR